MIVRPECEADLEAIRVVNRLAFGGDDEARIVDRLREGGFARLSLVAEGDRGVIGHILFSELPIVTSKGRVDALALAPMAVVPEQQRRGVGSALVREGLRLCTRQGARIVVVLGHIDYYPRFGFSAAVAEPLTCEYSGPALMAAELVPGALDGIAGVLDYPPPLRGT